MSPLRRLPSWLACLLLLGLGLVGASSASGPAPVPARNVAPTSVAAASSERSTRARRAQTGPRPTVLLRAGARARSSARRGGDARRRTDAPRRRRARTRVIDKARGGVPEILDAPAPAVPPPPAPPAPATPPELPLGPGPSYFVDSDAGDDAADGLSPATAWKSTARASAASLAPDSNLLLKRGGAWAGALDLADTGRRGQPIRVAAYGTGPPPRLTAAGPPARGCLTIPGSFVYVTDLDLDGCGPARGGAYVTGDDNVLQGLTVRSNEAAILVLSGADRNRLLGNTLTDNNLMTRNTKGGDDDYGAYGIAIEGGSYTEAAYNVVTGNRAGSFDYGADGSAFEVYGGSYNHIHHNTAVDNQVFAEIGRKGTSENTIAYNAVSSNLDRAIGFVVHGGGSFGPVKATRFIANSLQMTGTNSTGFACHAGCGKDVLFMRNNAVSSTRDVGHASAAFDEDYNVFNAPITEGLKGGVGLHTKLADPLFRSPTDLRLQPGSPAIDAGQPGLAPYPTDRDLQTVPFGGAPDAGAFEFSG